MRRFWGVLLFTVAFVQASAQFTLTPLPRNLPAEKKISGARTNELTPMPLPFWDDFSFSNLAGYPHDTLWQYGKTVWVNQGLGVNPPSLGVATFDGLDSLGNPYSVNDVLEKGIADRLVSRPISLDLVAPVDRNSVYLSFYYQFRGNGEPPDPGDQLRVLFKNAQGSWVQVTTIENDGSFSSDSFTQVMIAVTGDQYYHDNFQFSIISFGRLSGPYDTWNVDYVYLNKGRTANDTSYPDRTINLPLTSMLKDYYSMPYDHFMENPTANLQPPLISMHNLEFIPGNTNQSDVQPINYDSEDSVFVYRDGVESVYTHQLDLATSIGNPLQPLEFRQTPIQTLPDLTALTTLDSAARVKVKLWINSGDNIVPSLANPLGDYNIAKYAPIDFRVNDTTQVEFTLDNYYAYDDGTAEYGAALNQPGAQLAYLFEMKTNKPDTIVAIDFYFPGFGDETNQSILVQILRDLSGDPGSFLYTQSVTVQRSTQNKFWRLEPLSRFVGVNGSFYIGWKQSAASVLAVGLDKNTDSGDKIFFNINGQWEQNTNLTGSLMIRPVFGKGDGVITGVEENTEKTSLMVYPNPGNGTFVVMGSFDRAELFTLSGQAVRTTSQQVSDGTQFQIDNPTSGLYVLRIQSRTGLSTHKIIVR